MLSAHASVHARSEKSAALGGDGQDTSFEQAFANLAHAYLQDKAPSLQDHELGFQLIDRDQDGTKAVGVFAFKVGSQRLFAPVFFIKGELKGHELLFMRDADSFVPLKENWVTYILNRRPPSLGAGVGRSTSQLGVRPPELSRLSTAPSKLASAAGVAAIQQDFLPAYCDLTTADFAARLGDMTKMCNERLYLPHFLQQASTAALGAVVDLFARQPKIAAAFEEWHGMESLQSAIKISQAHDRDSLLDKPLNAPAVNKNRYHTGSLLSETKTAAESPQKIEVITLEQSKVNGLPESFSEVDREKLMRDGVLIRDKRDDSEKSILYNTQVEQKLTNPTETGIFQVLTNTGEYERCLLLMNPHGPNGRESMVTVIRLDAGARNWDNFVAKDVWIAGRDESLLGGSESWLDWFTELSDGSIGSEDNRAYYVAIGPNRDGTCPFRLTDKLPEAQGTKSYEVSFCRHPSRGWVRNRLGYGTTGEAYDSFTDGSRLHLDAKDGTQMRSAKGDLFVPKTYKLLKLTADSDESSPPIRPGRMLEATLGIMKKTAALRVQFDGRGYCVNSAKSQMHNEALISLVTQHGLSQDDSFEILKSAAAAAKHGHHHSCRIKYANPFLTDGGPNAPAYSDESTYGYNPMGFAGQTQSGMIQELPVPDMSASMTDRSIYNVNPAYMQEPMDANGVNQAVQSGQREIFDTSMIGSMLRSVRDDTMVDRYLPDLMGALDSLGRLLFMFYWHRDKFAERYGKQDMPELEDSLRNAFEMLGDVVIFLKQKTVEAYPEGQVQDTDL